MNEKEDWRGWCLFSYIGCTDWIAASRWQPQSRGDAWA